jgi:hypothetical protein
MKPAARPCTRSIGAHPRPARRSVLAAEMSAMRRSCSRPRLSRKHVTIRYIGSFVRYFKHLYYSVFAVVRCSSLVFAVDFSRGAANHAAAFQPWSLQVQSPWRGEPQQLQRAGPRATGPAPNRRADHQHHCSGNSLAGMRPDGESTTRRRNRRTPEPRHPAAEACHQIRRHLRARRSRPTNLQDPTRQSLA